MHIKKNKTGKLIVNPKVKPELLRNNEWQALLRKQYATIQKLKVKKVGLELFYSEFEVSNPSNDSIYRVAIRSVSEPKNYCECTDFKTNKLGTCKHIEAVFFYLENQPNFEFNSQFEVRRKYTSVYVDYLNHRKIKIRIGSDSQSEIKQIFDLFFDSENSLIEKKIGDFIFQLNKAITKFDLRVYDDAKIRLQNLESHQKRLKILDELNLESVIHENVKSEIKPHQLLQVKFILQNAKTLISNDVGLGLSFSVVTAIQIAKKYLKMEKVLIVSKNVNYWKEKFETHLKLSMQIVVVNKITDLMGKNFSQFPTLIASYSEVSNNLPQFEKLNLDFIVFDDAKVFESLKNEKLNKLKKINSPYRILLSDQDLRKNLDSVYSQIQVIDIFLPGSYFNFINRYALKNVYGQIVATKNEFELNKNMEQVYSYTSIKDCYSLKEVYFSKKIAVGLNAIHSKMYFDFLNQIVANSESKLSYELEESALKILKLCSSGFLFNYSQAEPKMHTLTKLLKLILKANFKILISTSWLEFSEFIQTFLLHNGFSEDGNILKNLHFHSHDVAGNLSDTQFDYVISLDILSIINVEELPLDGNFVHLKLIAESTFEEYLYDLIKIDKGQLSKYFSNYCESYLYKNSTQLSLLDISFDDNTKSNHEVFSVDKILEAFENFEKELTANNVKKLGEIKDNLPEKLVQFLKLY